jgi:hypothetical protein
MSDAETLDFDSVSLDSHVRHKCSPVFDKFEASVKGIKINAPGEIDAVFDEEQKIVSPSTRFPVCITMQFPLKEMLKYEDPRSRITLVLVRKNTGESLAGNLAYSRPRGPSPRVDLPAKVIETRVQRYYYNVNLCSYLRLPAVAGTYFLYATFEEYRSETLTITLREKETPRGRP